MMRKLEGWMARDEDGDLYIGQYKPNCEGGIWTNYGENMKLRDSDFPEVRFDNSPVHVELIIEGIKGDEIQSFIDKVKGTALQERRVWFPVMRELTDKPFNEIPFADKFVLAKEVKKMRSLQSQYFKTRSQDALKASIAQERKVDELVNNILNKL